MRYELSCILSILGLCLGANAQAITAHDCLFNWAEASFPDYFNPAGAASQTVAPFYFRYYAQSKAYLGVSEQDAHLYYLGPLSQNNPADLQVVSGWLQLAGCSDATPIAWTQNLKLEAVAATTVGGTSYASSSKLSVSWSAPTGTSTDYYAVTLTDSVNGDKIEASSTSTSVQVGGAKAGTAYVATVLACTGTAPNGQCRSSSVSAASVSASTADEVWQLQGTGNGYANATRVVSDGSTLPWAMRYGVDASASLVGKTRFYYKAIKTGAAGVGIATSAGTSASINNLSAYGVEASGLWQTCASPDKPSQCTSGDLTIMAIQALPLTSDKVQLYFEAFDASDTSATTRIYSLDSQDGLIGLDFNRGSGSSCGGLGSRDYAAGGNCEPTLQINAGTGSAAASSGLSKARQLKVGYPTLTHWRWDGAVGSFMVITAADACGKTSNGLFLAQLESSGWAIAKTAAGCAAPLVEKGHGPVPVHLGGVRYKLYFEDETNGHSGKPLRLMYANGALSGDASRIDFADWEAATQARQVTFLWPDGTPLSAEDESGLGDHMVLLPNDDLATQYMYLNLGGFDNANWNKASAGLGMAVLVNP